MLVEHLAREAVTYLHVSLWGFRELWMEWNCPVNDYESRDK